MKRLAAVVTVLVACALAMGSAGASVDHVDSFTTLEVNGWSGSAGPVIGRTFPAGSTLTFSTEAEARTFSTLYQFTYVCARPVALEVRYASSGPFRRVRLLYPTSTDARSCWASVRLRPVRTARWRMAYMGTSTFPGSHEDVIVTMVP